MAAVTGGLPRTLEGRAVAAAVRWDPADPAWPAALLVAMSRRGTRDAVLAVTAREGRWDQVLAALATVPPTGSLPVDGNVAAITAIACWAVGDTSAALAAAPRDGHQMGEMLLRMIDRGIGAEEWLQRVAKIDPGACMEFEH